jgi:hypothetical protein
MSQAGSGRVTAAGEQHLEHLRQIQDDLGDELTRRSAFTREAGGDMEVVQRGYESPTGGDGDESQRLPWLCR